MAETTTEIVRASELQERVVGRIAEIRNPDLFKSYNAELRLYKRRNGKREEVVRKAVGNHSVGFTVQVYDKEVFVERPARPAPIAYRYSAYGRSFGLTSHATLFGLLADPRYNRDIRPQRVDEYALAMRRGECMTCSATQSQ